MKTVFARPAARGWLLVGVLLGAPQALAEPPAPTPAPPAASAEPANAKPAEGSPTVPAEQAAEGDVPPPPEPDIYGQDTGVDELPDSGMASAISVFLKTLLALGFILLLAYLTLSKGVGKLVAKSQQGKSIKVVERIGLDQRRALFLIEVEGRRFLLGTSESGMTTLADLTSNSTGRPFAEVMQHTPPAAPTSPPPSAVEGAPA